MFESILADILNRYLKPYVKKLDTSQLRLGIWKGDVCLENLELKDHIFTDLNVPVIIKSSYIGKIILKIPWKNLTKESIIVTIEDVYVLAGPVSDSVYDEKMEKQRKWEKKQSKLKDIDEARKKQESKKEEKDSFVEKLITHIVKNLLVRVNSIHIRYEDTVTNPKHPMAAGITLDGLEMQTTDFMYKPCVIKETATMIFKLIQMDCLAFYWKVDETPMAGLPTDKMVQVMSSLIARKDQEPKRLSYILQPMTAQARLQLNAKPNYENYEPKVVVSITSAAMEMMFRRSQYCSLLDTMEAMDRGYVQQRYHKYRDKLCITKDKKNKARMRWEYAITCIQEELVKRKAKMWSWKHMKESRDLCKAYTAKYLDKITSISTSSSLIKELEGMEEELELFNILLCRQQALNQKRHKSIRKMAKKAVQEEAKAEAKAEKQLQKQKQQAAKQSGSERVQLTHESEKKKTGGFFSRLKGRLKHGDPTGEETSHETKVSSPPASDTKSATAAKESKTTKETREDNITAEQLAIEREKLFEAIGYTESGAAEEYSREYIAEKVDVKLKSLTLTLIDDAKSKKIAHVETRNISARIVHRPTGNGVTVHGEIGSLSAMGVSRESHDTVIISTPETREETGDISPLVAIQFDMNPLGMATDFMLFASLNPLEIIYDAETVDNIIGMFLVQKVIHFQELTAATMATVEELRTQTKAGLDYALKKRKLLDLKFSQKSPYIVVPAGGVYSSSASVVVVDLGNLEISSSAKEFTTSSTKELEDYYDTFSIKLTDIQVLVARPGEDWRHARVSTDMTTSLLHILKPAGVELTIQRSILQQDAFLPSLKVEAALSSFDLSITDARLKELMKVFLSLQIPPPSLKNATMFIDASTGSDDVQIMMAEKLNVVTGAMEQDAESVSLAESQSPPVESESHPPADRSQSVTVFTQLSLNLSVKQINMKLNHEEGGTVVKTLLHLQITDILADVKDRSWDTSAAISVGDIAIFDHIKLEAGVPVKLLEVDHLPSGKVLSLDVVLLSKTKKELAARLSSGESVINGHMSMLQLNVHEETVVELSRVAFLLVPLLLEIPQLKTPTTDIQSRIADVGAHVISKATPTKALDKLKMKVETSFKGLKAIIADRDGPFITTEVSGMQLSGSFSKVRKELCASMDTLVVRDLKQISNHLNVISVSGGDKKMLVLQAVLTTLPSDDNGFDQSEFEVNLKVQQLKIYIIMELMAQFMLMINRLHFDPTFANMVRERSITSKPEVKSVTSSTIGSNSIGSTIAKIRTKLNVHLHAPVVILPIKGSTMVIRFDLGNFEAKTGNPKLLTLPNGTKFIQETIMIETDGIKAERMSSAADDAPCELLPSVKFNVRVVRNLLEKPVDDMPLFDVVLSMKTVTVHLCYKEIVAFLLLISGVDELSQIGKSITKRAVGEVRRRPVKIVDRATSPLPSIPKLRDAPSSVAAMAKVSADLETLTLEVTPLCRAVLTNLETKVTMDSTKTEICTDIKMVAVYDHKSGEKITSYVDKMKSFTTLKVVSYPSSHEEIYSEEIPLPINVDIGVKVSSVLLILNIGFINRAIEFGQSVSVDSRILQKFGRVVADAASALPDQLARIKVFVDAPVIYLPLRKMIAQALVINCGCLKMYNSYNKLDGEIKTETSTEKKTAYVNKYNFNLTDLQFARSMLNIHGENVKSVASHTLLQPIQFKMDVSISLSPDVTSVPLTQIDANLGIVKVLFGEEDIKCIVNYVTMIVGSFRPKDSSEFVIEESILNETVIPQVDHFAPDQSSHNITADELAFNAILESFYINAFSKEPPLAKPTESGASSEIPSSFSLVTLDINNLSVSGRVKAKNPQVVGSKNPLVISAELKDLHIIDSRETSKHKKSNRLLQSFKVDPTKESSVKSSEPVLKVEFTSSSENSSDYVTIDGQQLFILVDVEYMMSIKQYVESMYENNLDPNKNETMHGAVVAAKHIEEKHKKAKFDIAVREVDEHMIKRPFKLRGLVNKLAIALLDPEQSDQPQVVMLQSSIFCNMVYDPEKESTQLSLNLDGLSITSCYLVKLDSPTSHILLPANVNTIFTMCTKDTNNMGLIIDIDCVTINMSPAIVSLVMDVVSTVVPKKKEAVEDTDQVPDDIWDKQDTDRGRWYLVPEILRRGRSTEGTSVDNLVEKDEGVSVEVKRFEINVGRGYGTISSELALNGNIFVEVKDLTGALHGQATLQLEASYFNDCHSLWEPLIEPLEGVKGNHILWTAKGELKRSLTSDDDLLRKGSTTSLSSLGSLADTSARYAATISAETPLQVTLSKKSLTLIKDVVEVYSANVNRDTMMEKKRQAHQFSTSESAFTITNKLGPGLVIYVKPGSTLMLVKSDQEFAKIGYGDSADIEYSRVGFNQRRSKSVLLKQPKRIEALHHVDIKIGSFDILTKVSVSTPGQFYYTLSRRNPKTNATDQASVVMEVIFSDTKKTIIIRSPLQVHNHLSLPIEVALSSAPEPYTVPANTCYPIPLDKIGDPISVRPAGKGFDSNLMLHWMSEDAKSIIECTGTTDSSSKTQYLKVVKKTEDYVNMDFSRIGDDSAHHVFDIYPPAVLCNLLPVSITVMGEVIGEGKEMTLLQLNPNKTELLKITLNDGFEDSQGNFPVRNDMNEYTRFTIGQGPMELSVHREDLGYHRLSLFAPYWMVNKTELTLEYRDFVSKKRTPHYSGHEIMCYSCDPSNEKSRIQFSAKMLDGKHTDSSAVISLNAAGIRGCARLKCGSVIHDLGIWIKLSKFTLTKIVTVTPFYLVMNETKHNIKCLLGDGAIVEVQPKNVRALWPKTDDPHMHITIRDDRSENFCYRNSDNLLLKMGPEVVAIAVEINRTEHSNVVTFSPYYPGAMPARIVNACDNYSIIIRQNTKTTNEQFILRPQQTMMYTWGDPAGTRSLWWCLLGDNTCTKPISLSQNGNGSFKLPAGSKETMSTSVMLEESSWIVSDELTENGFTEILTEASVTNTMMSTSISGGGGGGGYWVSFLDHLQRVVLFTEDKDVVKCAKAGEETGLPLLDLTVSLKGIGVSLVNNAKKKEIAYVGITQSSVIWEVKKKRNKWITLNNETILILEEAYKKDPNCGIEKGKIKANLSIMQMESPVKGRMRRTYYDGFSSQLKLHEKQIELGAKIGHVQIDNQLPFSIYPQLLYPLPPPPTVASTCEPKPFVEASVIIRRSDKVSMAHIHYVGLLIQEMAVNVDLGFLLSIISFFTIHNSQYHLGEYVVSNKKEALLPLKDYTSSGKTITDIRHFFTLIHFSPVKIRLSFNIRSYGKNIEPEEDTVAKQALNVLLHSLGVVVTSFQDTEMKYAFLHLEYRQVTLQRLKDIVVKHYTAQTFYQIYSLIFGLDMLGNPVSVVKGVAGGAIDLFYEPYKGVILGGDEFLQGLGIGLKSFLGGTVGGIAGAGAKVTGAVGDVFAKLTFDEEFIDRRQQQKAAPPRFGSKFTGFAKNIFQGVTGVVTQPVKGVMEEGVVGLAKGMGKGVVGLVLRPTGGLIDLASGGLDTVRRTTSLNNVQLVQLRPPRFIGKDGVLTPYSSKKAYGSALLVALEDTDYNNDCYSAHLKISPNPITVLLITDMRILVVQKARVLEGWNILWEVLHSKVSGVGLSGVTLEAKYKSKRSGFDKLQQLQSKNKERYELPNSQLAREAFDLIKETVTYQ